MLKAWAFLTLAAAGRVLGSGANTQPAVPNATATSPVVTATPFVVYQEESVANVHQGKPVADIADGTRIVADVFQWTHAVSVVSANALSYTIPQDGESQIKAVCWYPVSGTYGDFARWLFYGTIAFALIGRTHQWLVVGALGVSLTYSSAAAVHACVMVWSGRPSPNPDMWAALGIVSLAAALVVPLLNWSSTIKNLGKDREENSAGRTIIVYWACIIFIAFLTLWSAYLYRQHQIHDGHTESLYFSVKAYSADSNVTCSPSNGILDLTAGQQQGWNNLYITNDFIEANNCVNPCNSIVNVAGTSLDPILRDPKDLIPMNAQQINHFMENNLTTSQSDVLTLFNLSIVFGFFLLTWVVAQGITVVLFGRRKPSQVRNFVYVHLARLFAGSKATEAPTVDESGRHNSWAFDSEQHKIASNLAKSIAIVFYLWSWSASIISVLIAIIAMLCTEYIMFNLPQSGRDFEIDSWGSWAATALVVLVAFVYRFQGIGEDVLVRFLNWIVSLFYRCFHGRQYKHPERRLSYRDVKNRSLLWENLKDSVWRKTAGLWQDFSIATSNEWKENMDFLYRNPWYTALANQGHAHQRRRRVIGTEVQEFPNGWQLEYQDNWLEVEDFIEAVRAADAAHRRLHGKGYLWQPRVTEEAPLRRRFDIDMMKNMFRGGGESSAPHSRSGSMGPGQYSMISDFDPPRGLGLDDETVNKAGLEMSHITTAEVFSSAEGSPQIVPMPSPPPPSQLRRTVTFSNDADTDTSVSASVSDQKMPPVQQNIAYSSDDTANSDSFQMPQIPSHASSSPIIRAAEAADLAAVRPVRHTRTLPVNGSLSFSSTRPATSLTGSVSPDFFSSAPQPPPSLTDVAQHTIISRTQTPNREHDLGTSLGSTDSQPLLATIVPEDDRKQQQQQQQRHYGGQPITAEAAGIPGLRLQERVGEQESDPHETEHQRSDGALGGSLNNMEPTLPRENF